MLHQPVYISRHVRYCALRLPRVHLGELAKCLHLTIQNLIAALDIFDKLAGINVWITTIGNVVDDFGWDKNGSDSWSGGVCGVVCGEIRQCGERVGDINAVVLISVSKDYQKLFDE